MKVGKEKLPNSSLGSNSPKSFTNLSDKFSVTLFSSATFSTAISTSSETSGFVTSIFKSVEVSFLSDFKVGSRDLSNSMVNSSATFGSVLVAVTSECFEIVGCRFSTDNSKSDFS